MLFRSELLEKRPDLKIAVFEMGNELTKRHCPIDGDKVKSCIPVSYTHLAVRGFCRYEKTVWNSENMYAFQNQKRLIDDYMIKFVIEHEKMCIRDRILIFPIMGVGLYLLIGLNGGTHKMRERYARCV